MKIPRQLRFIVAFVWVIEKPDELRSLARDLMGNFPVRLIASLESCEKLLGMGSKIRPAAVVVRLNEALPYEEVDLWLTQWLPDSFVVYVHEGCDAGATRIERPDRVDLPGDFDIFELGRLIQKSMRSGSKSALCYRDIELDTARLTMRTRHDDESQCIPPKESQILTIMIKNSGKCVSRDLLQKEVWGGDVVSRSTIDSHVSRLRKRLEDTEVEINCIYGGGYVLK